MQDCDVLRVFYDKRRALLRGLYIILQISNKADGTAIAHTGPEYYGFVGQFGGATAATLLRAVLAHPDLLGEPVAQTVNFAAAVEKGPYRIEARPARTNRSTQHWQVAAFQGDDPMPRITATTVTGIRRAGWSHQSAEPPVLRDPSALHWLWCRLVLAYVEDIDLTRVLHPQLAGRASLRAILKEQQLRDSSVFKPPADPDVPPPVLTVDFIGGLAEMWAYLANFCVDWEDGVTSFGGRWHLHPRLAFASERR